MIKIMLSPHFRLRHYAGGIAVILLLVGIYFAALYAAVLLEIMSGEMDMYATSFGSVFGRRDYRHCCR